MSFEIDMLIPKEAVDDLGQTAKATITSLRYTLHLKINDSDTESGPITIVYEKLEPLTLTDTRKKIFWNRSS